MANSGRGGCKSFVKILIPPGYDTGRNLDSPVFYGYSFLFDSGIHYFQWKFFSHGPAEILPGNRGCSRKSTSKKRVGNKRHKMVNDEKAQQVYFLIGHKFVMT